MQRVYSVKTWLKNNFAAINGGGNCLKQVSFPSNFSICDLNIAYNFACYKGGGLCIGSFSNLIINNLRIFDNIAKDQFYGLYEGIYGPEYVGNGFDSSSNITLTNINLVNNYDYRDGGGIYINNCNNVSFSNSNILDSRNSFSYNIYLDLIVGNGGRVYIDGSSHVIMSNVSIINNTADNGGGMY